MKNVFLICITNPMLGGAWVPLSSGNLISYCIKNQYVKENYNFFPPEYRTDCLEREDFKNKLKASDIIGLTCYVWNQQINDEISKYFKHLNPNGIVIYGGPNVPESFNEAMSYADERPYVDRCFIGAGEKNFLNFLVDNNTEGTYNRDYFDISKNRKSYQLSRNETPTPFQDGIFDHIFESENNVSISFETTRGCPYSCAFCDWGSQSNSKVVKFDEEVIKKEIDHFTKYNSVTSLFFADANYGIFDRDVEILEYLCKNKNKLISVSFSGFAKNGTPRITKINDLLCDHFEMISNEFKISLQTMSPEALKTINRDNIKTEKLLSIIDSKKEHQIVSCELIIGLPGETAESWLDTLCRITEIGFESVKIHRLLILPNTPINDEEYIKKNNIVFKTFKVPKKILDGGSIISVFKKYRHFDNLTIDLNSEEKNEYEIFKTVGNCNSFDDEEFLKMHSMNFWYHLLIGSNFLRKHMLSSAIDLRDQAKMFFDNLENMTLFKSMHDEYISNIKKILDNDVILETYPQYFNIAVNKNMDAYRIYKNLDTAISEIKTIYPDAVFDHVKTYSGISLARLAGINGQF